MTQTNKTRQKLMDSMRKAKNADAKQAEAPTESVQKTRKTSASTRKPVKKQVDKTGDGYSSGRRVWPD